MAKSATEFDVHDATMRAFQPRNLRHLDWLLPLLVCALALAGWATLYSASRSSDVLYFQKQIVFFFIGLVVALVLLCIDYRLLVSLAPLMYAVSLLLLVAVLWHGKAAGGSARWLVVGPFQLQPSELAKLVMVYMLAWYLNNRGERIRKPLWFLISFVIVAVPMALIVKQPNLGTAGCLVPLLIVMLFAGGCRIRHLAIVIVLGFSLLPALWWQMRDFDPEVESPARRAFELEHYQKKRIYTFLHPDYKPTEMGWHTLQSKITVGSGGLSGKGYLKGTQTALNYLPEHHTDFIFSLLAEEHGFIGVVVVIGVFLAFLLRGLMYARDCPDMTGTLLATGIVTILAFHVFVNIAVTVGLMPVTGIPLPFLSYGGSFYLTTMACVGALLNVPMRRRMFVN